MRTDLIIVTEYCRNCDIEPSFIYQLGEDGLIDIQLIDQERYLFLSQLSKIEMFSRLHYQLSINVAGIDAINHLLEQINELKKEIHLLQNQLSVKSPSDEKSIEEADEIF